MVRRILWGAALLAATWAVAAGLVVAWQWSRVAFVAACLLLPAIALLTGARTWRSLTQPHPARRGFARWVRTGEGVAVVAFAVTLALGLSALLLPDLSPAIGLAVTVGGGILLWGPIAARLVGLRRALPASAPPAPVGPSLGYLGTTWLTRGPAYRRKRAVLLVNALLGCLYSVPWVVGIPVGIFLESAVGGVVTGLLAGGYLYWGGRRYYARLMERGTWRVRWWQTDKFDKRLAWGFLGLEAVLFLVWPPAAGAVLTAAFGIAGFLLAPSSIVELLLNLRRELPVETRARAQLTATVDAAGAESSRSL